MCNRVFQNRGLSRRAFLVSALSVTGLSIIPNSAYALEAPPQFDKDDYIPNNENSLNHTETVQINGQTITTKYSEIDSVRVLDVTTSNGEQITAVYYLSDGTLTVNDSIVGTRLPLSQIAFSENESRSDDGWVEIDRGYQSLTWVAGSTVIYVGTLIAAAAGASLPDILLSSWDAINTLIESGTSMDLFCIWEHYFTVTFQQTRVTATYLADGMSFGPFLWFFNNA